MTLRMVAVPVCSLCAAVLKDENPPPNSVEDTEIMANGTLRAIALLRVCCLNGLGDCPVGIGRE